MRKKLVSGLLALVMAGALSLTVFAAEATPGQPGTYPDEDKTTSNQVNNAIKDGLAMSTPEEAEAVREELKSIANRDDFNKLNLYDLYNSISRIEASYMSLAGDYNYATTQNNGLGAYVVGGSIAAPGGTYSVSEGKSSAPFTLNVNLTVGGAAAQPETPVFLFVMLPESVQYQRTTNHMEITHVKNNGSSEVLSPVVENVGPSGKVESVVFAVSSFSSFEFRVVSGQSDRPVNTEPVGPMSSEANGFAALALCLGTIAVLGAATIVGRKKLAA